MCSQCSCTTQNIREFQLFWKYNCCDLWAGSWNDKGYLNKIHWQQFFLYVYYRFILLWLFVIYYLNWVSISFIISSSFQTCRVTGLKYIFHFIFILFDLYFMIDLKFFVWRILNAHNNLKTGKTSCSTILVFFFQFKWIDEQWTLVLCAMLSLLIIKCI